MGKEEGWKVRGTEVEVYREEGRIWEDRSQGGREGEKEEEGKGREGIRK